MKKLLVVTALFISACSHLPHFGKDKPSTLTAPETKPMATVPVPPPEESVDEVANNTTKQ